MSDQNIPSNERSLIRRLLQFIDWQQDARPYEEAPKELHAAVNEARTLPDETPREPKTCTERDAARYEWLRDNWGTLVTHAHAEKIDSPRVVTLIDADSGYTKLYAVDPQTLDQAIDAAMVREEARQVKTPTEGPL